MNSDDPKLTAYALDELNPAERAEIEQLLREDPTALAEVEETKTFVAQLRRELIAEAGTPLTEAQKATVLAAAERVIPENVVPTSSPSRVRRWLPLAAGICALAGVASLFYVNGLVQNKASRSAKENAALLARFNEMQSPAAEESKREVTASDSKPDTRLAIAAAPTGARAEAPADPQGYTEHVNISGNTRTRDKVIRRESVAAPTASTDHFFEKREAPDGRLVASSSPAKAPAVTLAPPSPTTRATSPAYKLVPAENESLIASGSLLTKSGSGNMVISGGNLGMANASTAMNEGSRYIDQVREQLTPVPARDGAADARFIERAKPAAKGAGFSAGLAKGGTSSLRAPVAGDPRLAEFQSQAGLVRELVARSW